MRTTLVIDDDVLSAAKAIARQKRQTIGKIVSDLARSALRRQATPTERNGVPLLPARQAGVVVTTDIVNTLGDELL